jgi:ABC-type Zn uptake system ZnuABC Zn-binding protein ZnuA
LAVSIVITVLVVAGILLLLVRPAQAPQPHDSGKLQVVATIFPLADWLREIGGDDVEVHCLVSGGADPHSFTPTVSDVTSISSARAVLAVGLGLDGWAKRLVENAGRGEQLGYFETGAWITPLKLASVQTIGEHDEHEDAHGGEDPHFWLDPQRAAAVVQRMAEELGKLDAARREAYSQRAAKYVERLNALNDEVNAARQKIPAGSQIVTFHDAFGYLLARLNVKLAAVVQVSPGVEPSLQDVTQAERALQQIKQRAVFAEPPGTDRAAQLLAERLGVKVEVLDPMDAAFSTTGKTYIERLRHNLKVLVAALGDQTGGRGDGGTGGEGRGDAGTQQR